MPKELKEMEYPEALSGYVKLYNYKEPFMPFSEGFGFQGVLMFDGETDKVQCHHCGGWFDYLPHHLKKEHNMSAKQHKKIVGLGEKTALISEKIRKKLLWNGTKRFSNITKNTKKRTEEEKKKISKSLKSYFSTRESQNKFGTCPEQLKNWLYEKYKEKGRTPTKREIKNRYKTIVKVFGSFKEACRLSGIPYRKIGKNIKTRKSQYTDSVLLEYIVNFKKNNNRWPSYSDCQRGLIPSYGIYCRRFKKFKNAIHICQKKNSS